MEPKKIALLVGAVVVALVTALLARQMFTSTPVPVAVASPIQFAQPTGPKVLVAIRALPVGTIIDVGSFKYQPWPKDLVDKAYYIEGQGEKDALVGSVVRNTISAGQPITIGSVVQPGDRGFLAAALGPGMRAITVAVRAETSVAGFIFPGDRVDLMLTQTVADSGGGEGGGPSLKTTETIMRNLRVLATDQRTSSDDKNGQKEVKQFQTVTLEVTPRIGEKVAVAQTIGTLSLSLRPLAEDSAELERAIAAGQVNVPKDGDTTGEKRMTLQIAQRPSDSGATFVTGADVSRFQRRSMPSAAPVAVRAVERVPAGGGVKGGGPIVRVARGNAVTEVPIGGK